MLITIIKLARFNRAASAGDVHALQAACAALRRWHQDRKAAAELHTMSDYSLRDIGVARSQIDAQVRLAAQRYVRPTSSTGLI